MQGLEEIVVDDFADLLVALGVVDLDLQFGDLLLKLFLAFGDFADHDLEDLCQRVDLVRDAAITHLGEILIVVAFADLLGDAGEMHDRAGEDL